ncbi:alpha/beta hydrolase [Agrococcus sp. ARC_14]|uniref:alpha/beta fold hydrolase n=1 Tax=Agrococcus sp. ARC_14 TaxID=2919927 RepID=UPI001F0663DE|nr:alpha/beta hydrolase [Agrococcus sp. ARC_14]MCH1884388.1 alpha/beta hydrolase [Agrococcus sp. ARC_14]
MTSEPHAVSLGAGTELLALHGAYSTHAEAIGFLEPALGEHRRRLRRIYPDLPGMGDSPADGIASSRAAVDALERLVDAELADAPLLVLGHSFGAHLAQGLAARRPEQVRGLALLCPLVPSDQHPEPHPPPAVPLPPDAFDDEALRAEFEGYFVVHDDATVRRFQDAVVPSLGRFDGDAVEAIMRSWQLDPDPRDVAFAHPVLVMVGRDDSTVGQRQHRALLEQYPAATAHVVAGSGHALPHERPQLLEAALADWIEQSLPA